MKNKQSWVQPGLDLPSANGGGREERKVRPYVHRKVRIWAQNDRLWSLVWEGRKVAEGYVQSSEGPSGAEKLLKMDTRSGVVVRQRVRCLNMEVIQLEVMTRSRMGSRELLFI